MASLRPFAAGGRKQAGRVARPNRGAECWCSVLWPRSPPQFSSDGPLPYPPVVVLYTVYGAAEHAAGAVHATKEEADAAEESGQDEPPLG